jgi:hypothetical protein
MPLLVRIAKWTGAVCGVLALPFAAIALIFAAYGVADAVRSFGAPVILAVLVLVAGGTAWRKRHAKIDVPV